MLLPLLFNALFWAVPAYILLVSFLGNTGSELVTLLLGLAVLARMGNRV